MEVCWAHNSEDDEKKKKRREGRGGGRRRRRKKKRKRRKRGGEESKLSGKHSSLPLGCKFKVIRCLAATPFPT